MTTDASEGGALTTAEREWARRVDMRLERRAPPRMVELRIEQIKADAYAAGVASRRGDDT